ncbi:MAG TPA: hypothetical protein VMI34_23495 [Candidatus Bathyarchaeia archaeon]|nr:hypothetical protein [Candidatus Bathyarchaeia archaeon]
MTAAAPGITRAPATMLPLSYLMAAAVAFLLACAGAASLAGPLTAHYYQPRVVALAHTVTLGWISLSIMGASYQLIPVVLERTMWSERLGRWQLGMLLTGIAGMVTHFFIGRWPGLLMAAAMVALGAGMHLVNVAMTLRGLGRFSFTARLMTMGFAGFGLTALFGLLLGADRIWKFLPTAFFPTLHAHFHLALLGWVAPMIMGVSARAYPMFLLAPEPDGWPAPAQLWGLALGVPAVVGGLTAWPALVLPGAFAVSAAVVGHLTWVARMARDRKRPRLDWGLRFVLTGGAFLFAGAALGLGLALDLFSGPRVAMAYTALALGGWASLTIVGMMLKIVPFLVWYRVYSSRAGRAPVPTLAQLGWPAAEGLAYGLLTCGMAGLAAALAAGSAPLILAAGAVLAAGSLCFCTTLARMLWHLAACGQRPVPTMGAHTA